MSGAAGAPVERVVEAADGTRLHALAWTPAEGGRARLVLVHGLGEHAGRYDEVCRHLASRGVSSLAFDQRGHGRSPGGRGAVGSLEELVADVGPALDLARRELPGAGEPFLFGHSMGGLVALRWAQTRDAAVLLRGLVLSAPWLGTAAPVSGWKRAAAALLRRLAPRVTLGSGIDASLLSRDPEKRSEYDEDPLVHGRVSAGLYHTALRAQERALEEALPVGLPVLVVVPLDDAVTDAAVTRSWAEGLRREGEPVSIEALDGFRHEAHQELGREGLHRTVASWMLERSPGEPVSGGRVPSGRAAPDGGARVAEPQAPEDSTR